VEYDGVQGKISLSRPGGNLFVSYWVLLSLGNLVSAVHPLLGQYGRKAVHVLNGKAFSFLQVSCLRQLS